MENLCRICGSEDGIKVNIFEPGSERVKKIHKVLPITVNEHDPFPKQMCHHCSYKVEQFYEFRTTSIKTKEMLRGKVPWLKDKQLPQRDDLDPPMVQVSLNLVNAVSPSEKFVSPSNVVELEMDEDVAIVIEDSPPYADSKNALASDSDEQSNPTQVSKSKKSKSRSMWDTKRRKKKSRKPCRILEVFTTDQQAYQNLNNIENDPLCLSTVHKIGNNSCDNVVENNTCAANSPKSELSVVEKGILTDDRGGDNIALPNYILTTKIPRVGNVYTCERCGITFLKPQPASQHKCPGNRAISVEEERPKEEPPQHCPADVEMDTGKDYYQCGECGHVFTRHSQLVSHQKKHNDQVESSSDDNFKPFNKRRKHHTKKKHKRRLLDTNNYNSNKTFETTESEFLINVDAVQTNITRHSLLSSDSE